MDYHVSIKGDDNGKGTNKSPFRTISRAARMARPGDTVTVHAGVYREWVSPTHGGTAAQRIVYQAAGDGETIITGAEALRDWQQVEGPVWRAEVDNGLFTLRNPFKEELRGDWLFAGAFVPHLGEVYLNGRSLYECASRAAVASAEVWPQAKFPSESRLKWYAEAGRDSTTIWANFGGLDPRAENVEISVRPYCFWPEEEGRGYITVRGFRLQQAAPQWAPPTSLQEGLIGPHWSKGWIIEDNIISESKCAGISLGKKSDGVCESEEGRPAKGGTQREQEVIFRALRQNWHKETIGSHIVRNNVIHDCEQAGIVGHLGAAFSKISGNRIYRIHHKRIFHGAEVGGIKLHAALDTQISRNVISASYRGLWLDWQAQGTRISGNVFFDNLSEDFFVEVCHGPYLADHNLFLSPMNLRNMSQGGAFVHNLFAGRFVLQPELSRFTPYHMPHETAAAGYSNISGGDDRFYNNLFIRDDDTSTEPQPLNFFEHLPLIRRKASEEDAAPVMDGVPDNAACRLYPAGLSCYDTYPVKAESEAWAYTPAERKALLKRYEGPGREPEPLPVAFKNNLYLKNAVPAAAEVPAGVYPQTGLELSLRPAEGRVRIRIKDPAWLCRIKVPGLSSAQLGRAYQADMAYEDPDGRVILFDRDLQGRSRDLRAVTPGPFEIRAEGEEPEAFTFG